MTGRTFGRGAPRDDFDRLRRIFVEHYGIALGLLWAATLFAASQAPWTRNIRGLLDPLARPESTASYLFALPLLMTAGWLMVLLGGETIRRSLVLRNHALEFALAGLAAFAVLCLAISRIVTVVALGA